MSRSRKKLRPFVPMRRDLLKDPGFRSLSNTAKIIYIYLRFNSNGNWDDKTALPYSQLEDMFHPATICKGFNLLIEKGFIKKIYKGNMRGTASYYKFIGKYANPYESSRK
ncbi:MAG: hypothetical protein HQ509_04710 [Candidatus Marinimicrobia bacterium]|nr:hypothetical protein [Candidatus Neomarinimicrobiota bacterium]